MDVAKDKMAARGKIFRSLPVSDWHQIIAFEVIVRNYCKMKEILKYVEKMIDEYMVEKEVKRIWSKCGRFVSTWDYYNDCEELPGIIIRETKNIALFVVDEIQNKCYPKTFYNEVRKRIEKIS